MKNRLGAYLSLHRKPLIIAGISLLVIATFAGAAILFIRDTTPVIKQPVTSKSSQPAAPALEKFASGFRQPTDIQSPRLESDKRVFVVERGGLIKIIKDGVAQEQPFLDISDRVQTGGVEQGLLGLAFHPNFAVNGYFYVNYTYKTGVGSTVIARFTGSGDSAQADTEQTLFTFDQPFANHNGGGLAFGPIDKYLYIGLGDGGGAGDPHNNAQNPKSPLGKMLRINVATGEGYSIPADNPYPFGEDGNRKELWALGLRNPWRFSFDKRIGDLYVADVGQNKLEEINIQRHGDKAPANYGWRCYEGSETYNVSGCADKSSYIAPLFEYDHAEDRCSITGGAVYRGSRYPALEGRYIYGDYCNGQLFSGKYDGTKLRDITTLKTGYYLSTFGTDSSGEIYTADYKTGTIYRLVDSAN